MTFRDREPKLREDWENTAPNSSSSKNDASCPSEAASPKTSQATSTAAKGQ
jgi:hypothetical protein